jgi:hypothetical protein
MEACPEYRKGRPAAFNPTTAEGYAGIAFFSTLDRGKQSVK